MFAPFPDHLPHAAIGRDKINEPQVFTSLPIIRLQQPCAVPIALLCFFIKHCPSDKTDRVAFDLPDAELLQSNRRQD